MVTTAAVLAVVERSPHNWGEGRRRWLEEELAKLGATTDDLVAAAVEAMAAEDRNTRVRAVWVLSAVADPRATEAILGALRDPSRRVREVAIKSARPHHVASPEVVAALRSIAEDPRETNRLRGQAFFVLSSSETRAALPEVAREALTGLMDSERFRSRILLRLCTSPTPPTAASREILQDFVRTGTKEEAVLATRALCDQLLVRVDGWMPPDVRQRVRETYDPAPALHGGTGAQACWMPREDALELARSLGYARA